MSKKHDTPGRPKGPALPCNIPLEYDDCDIEIKQVMTKKEFLELPPNIMSRYIHHVFESYAEGKQLIQLIKQYGFTIWSWNRLMRANPHLYELSNDAKEALAEKCYGQILDICDDGSNDWMQNRYGDKMVDREAVARSQLRVTSRLRLAEHALATRKFIFESADAIDKRLKLFMKKFAEGEISPQNVHTFLKAFETEANIAEKHDWMKRLEKLEQMTKQGK